MTTLHITNAWHATSGGIRTFYQALLDGGNRLGRRVVVVAPAQRAGIEPVGDYGCLYFVPAPPAPAFDRRYRLITPDKYMPFGSGCIRAILERERPHVVEIADKYSLPYLAALLRRGWFSGIPRPALVGLSCERFDDNMAAYLNRSPVARRFTQWYIHNVYGPPFDVHVANSEYTADELRRALPERAPDFVRVCPMGVDTTGFAASRGSRATRAQLLRQCKGDRDTTLLLYAGRLSPEKNLGMLLDALKVLVADGRGDYRLVLAGDGPLAEHMRREATGLLQDRLLFLGNLDREALAACYASCDVFVHPNPREPFGIGPLEAMASGIPVVVPDRGGVLTYANASNAWLAAPNAEAFVAAIRSASRLDRVRLASARATAEGFRWADATDRFFTLYDEVQHRFAPERSGHAPSRPHEAPSHVGGAKSSACT